MSSFMLNVIIDESITLEIVKERIFVTFKT